MKDELNRKVITICIGNDFEEYMKYRFGLGWIRHEKWVKIPILGTFRGVLPVGLKSYR